MDAEVCKRFENVRKWISDELIDGNYQFNDNNSLNNKCNNDNYSDNYCNNDDFSDFVCNNISLSDLNKISAGCLYLLDEFIKDCGMVPPPARNNINIVDYILIWLSYMLNLKESEKDNTTCFYSTCIYDCDKYNTEINKLTDYKSYKGLIDTKIDVLNMDSKIVSKFYKAFKLLCEMYTEFDEKKNDCTKCLGKSEEFVKIYKELNDPDNTNYEGYCQAWSTLSNDYKNLKNKYKNYDFLPEIDTTQSDAKCSEQTSKKTDVAGYEQFSEDTSSSSSIASKLIPVLLIFPAIPIFLGIAYKYSLFGFRKRFQKQKLREKLKNVKKRMNH
ncbi:PIR protein [Plasmodium yoelii]|uniref:PIR protein n=2 Tax=Plasmodium yoelii TaxID=5861 RepID=A0AAF0B277_PLAYO|nr:PIR protein [Plasmodium yoelii]WBY54390.1 PIR protein [Plasmodium yoelii yoelii]VTZ71409.1 PIR protein [Plasmodium yoelii]|eukprot:XP_022810937.1 PIR protein [Plasmodium yoelii]